MTDGLSKAIEPKSLHATISVAEGGRVLVEHFMTEDVFTVSLDMSVLPTARLVTLGRSSTFVEAYRTFLSASVHRLLVTDGSGKLQGIVSRSNLLRMLINEKAGTDPSLPKTDVA